MKAKGPNFELFPGGPLSAPKVFISQDGDGIIYSSGPLTAKILCKPGAYNIDFLGAGSPHKILTSSGPKAQAQIDIPHKWTLGSAANTSVLATDRSANPHPAPPPEYVRYILNELTLAAGELVYGLGEQFGPFVKNGQVGSDLLQSRSLHAAESNASNIGGLNLEPRRRNIFRTSLQNCSLLSHQPWLRDIYQSSGGGGT